MGCLVHAAACASYFMPQQTRLAPPLAIPPPPFRRGQPSFTHIGVHHGQRRRSRAVGLHQASERKPSQGRRWRLPGQKSQTGFTTRALLHTSSQGSPLAWASRPRVPQPLLGLRRPMPHGPTKHQLQSPNGNPRSRVRALRSPGSLLIKRYAQASHVNQHLRHLQKKAPLGLHRAYLQYHHVTRHP